MENKEEQKQPEIKYLCIGGNIFDKFGGVHFVGARKLPSLYKVSPENCIFADKEEELAEYEVDYLKKLLVLMPRSDGKYTTPDEEPEEKSPIILPKGVKR